MMDVRSYQGELPACRRRQSRKPTARLHRQTWSALELRTLLEATVASGFDIDEERLRQPTRGEARIALARQVAMYLAHIGCGLSKAGVGRLFERDRTTVHHACLVIEHAATTPNLIWRSIIWNAS